MAGSPINEGDIEIQLVESDGDDANNNSGTNGSEESDRLEHFYTALNWVKQELAELKEQDQNILQNFLSVRNTLYSIWETHRLIVKEQEEMKYYNENDDKSDVSSPPPISPTSPAEKIPLGRLGSGLFSSIQKQSEERGITSPITKKPIFTLMDVQEVDTSNDVGPPGCLVSEEKPWYETGSFETIEQLPKPVAGVAAAAHHHFKSPSKASVNHKRRQHIYESIDDVLAELKQTQGSSPNYATLHRWTNQLDTPGSTNSSSSGSTALDSKSSSSDKSSRSVDDRDSTINSVPSKSTTDHDLTGNITSDYRHSRNTSSNTSRPNSAKEKRSHSYSAKLPNQDVSHTPPLQSAATPAATSNQPQLADATSQVRHNRKLSFPAEVTSSTAHPTHASSQVRHSRQPSGPELQSSIPNDEPGAMVRSQSARWIRRQSHQPGRSQSPTVNNPTPVNKDGYFTPQLTRSVQNGAQQHQSPNARFSPTDEYNPLAEEHSISMNFSNEILSIFNFQQQPYSTSADKYPSSRTASSSSAGSHGRRSVPLKPSPSPDLCVNPLGGPKISPPPIDNQTSSFCHVPRRQSGNVNLASYKGPSNAVDVLSKLGAKRSVSGSNNNLLNDTMLPHAAGPVQHRNSLSYQSASSMPSSPGMIRRESVDPARREIVDCPSSPRFPRRSLTRSPGQTVVYKGTNLQVTQPRIAKFTAPPPPTVAPPKLSNQYSSSDFRPTMGGHVRPSKVEQTWC